ncbi:hypothetical protein ACWD6I_13840 [Streptomyces sp. NPDC002454]
MVPEHERASLRAWTPFVRDERTPGAAEAHGEVHALDVPVPVPFAHHPSGAGRGSDSGHRDRYGPHAVRCRRPAGLREGAGSTIPTAG